MKLDFSVISQTSVKTRGTPGDTGDSQYSCDVFCPTTCFAFEGLGGQSLRRR